MDSVHIGTENRSREAGKLRSSTSKKYASAMRQLKSENPPAYEAISAFHSLLKNQSMRWRLQAQGKLPSATPSQAAFDGEVVQE